MAIRGTDIIGQALMNALSDLGGQWGSKIASDRAQEKQNNLIGEMLNAKTEPQYQQTGQYPSGPIGPGQPVNLGVQNVGSQPIPVFDPSNAAKLSQLSPQALNILQMTQPRGHIFPNTPAGTSEVQVDAFGNPIGPVRSLAPPTPDKSTQKPNDLHWIQKDLMENNKPVAYAIGYDPVTGEEKKRNKIGSSYEKPPAAAGNVPQYGPLNEGQQRLVDKIGKYEYDPKLLQGYRGADKNQIMSAVADQYPGYNSMEFPIRAKAAADFRSPNGVAGRNVTAINTAIGHMADLNKAAVALQNGDVQLWNKIKNFGLTQTGDPRVTSFLAAANPVEGEITKVFAGKAGTDQEIKAWRDAINTSQSPEQLGATMKMLSHLLYTRIATLNWQAEQNVGSKIPLLSNRSKQVLTSLGLDPTEFDNAMEAEHTRTPGDVVEGDGGVKYRFKGGNEQDKNNWIPVK